MSTAYRIQPPATAFSLSPAGKGRRRPREKDDKHLAWLRTLPCAISGRRPTEACHIRFSDPTYGKFETPMHVKPHDKWAVPLHPDLHREQHSQNERQFWLKYGLDPCRIASALYGETGNDEAAEVILQQARQMAATMVKP